MLCRGVILASSEILGNHKNIFYWPSVECFERYAWRYVKCLLLLKGF
jgi:hypothetical protein